MKNYGLSLFTVMVLAFSGCGGGGGSSSNDDSLFPSNAVVAKPTLQNGQKVEDATTSDNTAGVPFLNSVESNSKLNVSLLGSKVSNNLMKKIKNVNLDSYSLNRTIDETETCSGGGDMHISGSAEDNIGGTITMTMNNCIEGNEKVNGSIYVSISNKDRLADEFKDLSIKFTTDFTVTNLNDDTNVKMSKNSYMNINVSTFDYYDDPEDFKLTMSFIVTDGVEKFGMQDCIFYFSSKDNQESMYQTSGNIYINNLASYVSYDTTYDMSKTPFVFDYSYNLISGEAHYNMANNGKVKIVAESNEAKTYVDANGDGTYELREQ